MRFQHECRQCSGQGDVEAKSDCVGDAKIRGGIRRWNRENACAPVGGEEGNVAEGEQAAESDHHREGVHPLPMEDYMVYTHTFSVAPQQMSIIRLDNGRKSWCIGVLK
jgi:hypothetical protein